MEKGLEPDGVRSRQMLSRVTLCSPHCLHYNIGEERFRNLDDTVPIMSEEEFYRFPDRWASHGPQQVGHFAQARADVHYSS